MLHQFSKFRVILVATISVAIANSSCDSLVAIMNCRYDYLGEIVSSSCNL
jgi:hypothetical protein